MKKMAKAVFALGVLSSLGFGAGQALAAPAEKAAPTCDPARCDERCKRSSPNLVGRCLGPICECMVLVEP